MSLGSTLKQARNSVGMSIEDLAERTSIRAALLRDFEQDDFSKCGGDTYARGHVRNIANALNFEPITFLDLYDSEHSTAVRPMYDLLLETKVTTPVNHKSRLSLKMLSTISASAVVLVIGGQIAYTNFLPTKGSATKSFIASTAPTPNSSGATPAPSSAPAPATGAVTVTVSATRADSWLSVSSSTGVNLFAGRLVQGTSNTFTDSQTVTIRFGNAGAVDVVVNGQAIPTPGALGEVVDRTFGSNSSN